MPIGPTTYFGKGRVFVDREVCIQAFRENIQNSGNLEYNVLFYHGIAGIGKSKLQKELQKILDEEYPEIFWAAIDLNTKTYREVGTFLIALRNKIQEKYKSNFYLFNTAHAIYWKKLHPEIPLLEENYPLFKEEGFFSKIVNVLNEFGPAHTKLIFDILNNAQDNIRRFFKEQAIDINVLTAMEAPEIEKLLPGFFAADFTNYLGTDSKAYIFIDTYEALWEGLRNKGSFHEKDEWIRDKLILNMLGVSWVICGREKLLWAEFDSDWEMYLEQHSVDELPKRYSEEFLENCGIEDKDIRDEIIKASEGVPYYLSLSADTYEIIKIYKKVQPTLEDFVKITPNIFNAFVKYLDRSEIKALEVLSIPNFWDRELFEILMKKFDTGFSNETFSELIRFSFIKSDDSGRYSINKLMRKSLQEHQFTVERENVNKFMFEYYNDKLKEIDFKAITSENEITLTEAFNHAKESLEAENLLSWFVASSDPFNKAAFWQLITPMYEEILQIIEAKHGPQHSSVAETLYNLAVLYRYLGDYEKAFKFYQRALDIREKVLNPQHPDIATTLNSLALIYRHIGEYEKALPLCQKALDIREKVLGLQHPDVAETLNNFAGLYRHMGEYEKALPLCQRGLDIREKVLGSQHPSVANSLNNLAAIYENMGNYEKSLPLYQRALEIREKTLGREHPDVATTINGIAELYRNTGNYENSLLLYQRALKIREKTLGKEHPDVAETVNGIAELYKSIGNYEKSLSLYRRALEIREKTLGKEHPEVALTLNNISEIYNYLEMKDEALVLMKRAFSIFERVLPSNHPSIATSLNNLALLYQNTEESEKAKSLYKKSLDIYEKTLGPDHPSIAITLNNLAALYNKNEEYELALPLLKRALGINRKNFGDHNSEIALTLSNISALYVEMSKPVEAKKHYEQAFESYERILGKSPNNSLYQYLYANNLNNFGKFLENSSDFADAKKYYKRSLEIITDPLNEKMIEAKSKAIAGIIQVSFNYAKNETNSLKKEQLFYGVYQLYEKYFNFISEQGFGEQGRLIKNVGVNAYIQNLVLAAQSEPEIDKRIEKYNTCICEINKIALEEDDEELKAIWISIMHYLEGRKLINEATKSVLPDVTLIEKAIEQFELAKDKHEAAQACYCIYKVILELSDTEVLNDEALLRISGLLEIAEDTFQNDMDQTLKSIFTEIKHLIEENYKEVDYNIFFRLNHYIEKINYYALRSHFNYVAQKVMFLYNEEAQKKARFSSDSTLKTEFNKPEKEAFSPEVSYRNWTVEIRFNEFDKIEGKIIINIENINVFSGYLRENKMYIPHRLCKQEEIVEIMDHNGNRILRKISYSNTIECNGKHIDVHFFEQNCSKINQEKDWINIGVVQLKYHLYKDGYSLEIENSPRYRKKVFSILDALVKKVDLVVFPEFSIPFEYLSDFKKYSDEHGIIIIAGSHYVKGKNLIEYGNFFDTNFGDSDLLKNICPVIVPSHEKIYHIEKVCGAGIEREFLKEKMENGTLNRIFKFYDNLTCGIMICFDFLKDELRSSIGEACNIVLVPQSNPSPNRFYSVAEYDISKNPKYQHNMAYIMANGIFTFEKNDTLYGGKSGVILTLDKNSVNDSSRAIVTSVNKEYEQFVLIVSLYTKFFASRETQGGQIPLETEIIHIYDKQDLIDTEKRNVETFLDFLKEIGNCENSSELRYIINNNEKMLKEYSPLMHKNLSENLSDLNLKRIKNRCQYILLEN
jgi:tetratricopeptide (TPR) repeat protein/predicted amidohydrolase